MRHACFQQLRLLFSAVSCQHINSGQWRLVGARWITDRPNGREESDFDLRVTARETITVPAGSFDCFKVEFQGLAYGPKGPVEMQGRYWMAPDRVRQMIAQEILRKQSKSGKVLKGLRRELVSYQQG